MFENLKGFFFFQKKLCNKEQSYIEFQLNRVHKWPTDDRSFEPSSLNRVGVFYLMPEGYMNKKLGSFITSERN